MSVKIDHFKLSTESNKEIKNNFRKSLKNSNSSSNSKMSQVDGDKVDFTKLTQDQIKHLSALIQKANLENSNNPTDNSGSSSSSNSNEILKQLLTDPDPLRLNCKSAKQRSIHPWSKNLSFFSPELMSGHDVTIDVGKASDLAIIQAITAWVAENKDKITDHQKRVLKAIQLIYPDEFQLFNPANKSVSILAQIIFYIDTAFYDLGGCDESKVQELIQTFRGHRRFRANNNNQFPRSSSFSSSRVRNPDQNAHRPRQNRESAGYFSDKVGTIPVGFCRPYNITGTCPYGSSCQYRHKCNKCYNKSKSEEGHAGVECSQC